MDLITRKGRKKGVKGIRIQIADLANPKSRTYSLTVHNETPKSLFDIIKFMIQNMVRNKKFKLEVHQREWQKKE